MQKFRWSANIKKQMVTHKYQLPFEIDFDKFPIGEFTIKKSGLGFLINLKYNIPGGVDHKQCNTSFRVRGLNVIQTSTNTVIAHESFIKFIHKLKSIS